MKKQLKDICTITMGQSPDSKTYNSKKNGLPFFQGNADFGEKYPTARVYCSEPKKIAESNDILISVRAPIGALNFSKEQCCIGRGLASLRVKETDLCGKEYLYAFLKSQNAELNRKGTGSTFSAIGKSALEDLIINLPTLSEQQKIAAELDTIQSAIDNKKQQLSLLDEAVKSEFVEMFGDKKFPTQKWDGVFITKTGKLDSNAMVEGGKYPFFTCAKEIFSIDNYAFDQEALLLAGNNAAGKYDVKYYKGKFNAYQRTYVLSLKEDWSYRLFQFQLEDKLLYLKEQSKGINTKFLTLKILQELEFIIPPKELQLKFETFVQQIDKSKFVVKQQITDLQELLDSKMQEYFGE